MTAVVAAEALQAMLHGKSRCGLSLRDGCLAVVVVALFAFPLAAFRRAPQAA